MPVNFYNYVPSATAAALSVGIFAMVFCLHFWSMCRTRAWLYIPLVVGTVFEAAGYAFRIYSHSNFSSVIAHAGQSVLILIAAPLVAATMYMLLGRIICALRAERYSIIPTKRLTRILVTGDVFCFLLQSTGCGLLVTAAEDMDTIHLGKNIILGGLILQIVLFGIFILVAATFLARLFRNLQDPPVPYLTHMTVLFLSSAYIMIRNVARIFEYVQGFDEYIMNHEAFIYSYDQALMASALLQMWLGHAGSSLQERRRADKFGLIERDDSQDMALSNLHSYTISRT